MNDTQRQLLSILSHTLFKTPTTFTLTDEVKSEAQAHAVSTLISVDYGICIKNIRVSMAHAQLTNILANIPFTTFKGYASAYYYPQPNYRHMGDVDFIVSPADYQKTVDRLLAEGYIEGHSEHVRHKTFWKNKIALELHSEIKGIPNGKDGIVTVSSTAEKCVRALLADLIETAQTVDTQYGPIIIPDDFHHGLIMLLHVAGHMINNDGVGLRHLCDWATYCSRVSLEQYRDKLESVGLWAFACQLTATSTLFLGLPKQSWVGDWDEQFLADLIEDVLAAGNFGKKEPGRGLTAWMQRSSFTNMTRIHYPQANTITLPLYMIAYIVRYGILLLRGKRRLIMPSTILGAKRRNDLYSQFRLFEKS